MFVFKSQFSSKMIPKRQFFIKIQYESVSFGAFWSLWFIFVVIYLDGLVVAHTWHYVKNCSHNRFSSRWTLPAYYSILIPVHHVVFWIPLRYDLIFAVRWFINNANNISERLRPCRTTELQRIHSVTLFPIFTHDSVFWYIFFFNYVITISLYAVMW